MLSIQSLSNCPSGIICSSMILCPNAKINLGLEVVRRREDGYHDIETVFVPVPSLRDVLEVVRADEPGLKVYGLACDVPAEKNLCFKAFRLMQERFGIGGVNIFLYKNIPMGAGLGGGSSDAAFTLVALNEVFELGLTDECLAEMASELGSDCPFFIYNRPMFASGRGEILTPYPLDLSGYHIEVVTPGIHISTAEAYAGVDAVKGLDVTASHDMAQEKHVDTAKSTSFRTSIAVGESSRPGAHSEEQVCAAEISLRFIEAKQSLLAASAGHTETYAHPESTINAVSLRDKLNLDINTWRENVVNDFEAYAFAKYPILADIKQSLYDRGAVYASMTGSGSAIYGIFPD